MSARPLALAAAMALSTLACAHTPARFVARGRFDEALCASTTFSSDKAADAATFLHAVNERLRPAMHVHAITKQELTSVIGPAGERVNDRVLIARVVATEQETSGLSVHPDLEIIGGGAQPMSRATGGPTAERGPGLAVAPTRELLAALTGESLPEPKHVETGPDVFNKAAAMAQSPGGMLAGVGELLTFGLVPVMELAGVVPPHRSYDVPPTDAAFLEKAPAAETLYRSFKGMSGTVLLFTRPTGDDVALRSTWSYSASSYDGPCNLVAKADIDLPGGGSIEDRINSRFGTRMQALTLKP